MKRSLLVAVVSSLIAATSFAYNPSGRYETPMVYDPQISHMILFGGLTAVDSGTVKAYHLDDTWEWTGTRWIQRFPAHSPAARSGHVMVYDSNHSRILMFGGRGDSDLNDTWAYVNHDWVQIDTPNSPPGRILMGGAYDPVRDRLVMFGGTQTSADGKTLTPLHDTWEFDGTTWNQVGGEGPAVTKTRLVRDGAPQPDLTLAPPGANSTRLYKQRTK